MIEKITRCIDHLKQLNDHPFTLQKVAYWLYEYDDFYKSIKEYSQTTCEYCQKWERQGLPYDCLEDAEYCTGKYRFFTDFYEGAVYGIKIQEFEEDCRIALLAYNNCESDLQLKEWLINHYTKGAKLTMFYYNHLDYTAEKGETIHPHFGNSPCEEFAIFIDRKYYENIIHFHEIFQMLFYDKKLYPEKLKEIQDEMKNIVLPKDLLPNIKY